MATKDNNSPGLLSKVAKFVRNPTTNWTDLDKQDPEPDNGYSKQALKEMIERKRQNDFVRRREFDQLRKLRNRDLGAGNPDLAGRPSYFQGSTPSNPGERASTIQKIDEIEAQMSNQWWQGKTGGGSAAEPQARPAALPAAPRSDAQIPDDSYAATKLAPMAPEASPQPRSDFTAPPADTADAGPPATPPSHRSVATARTPERSSSTGAQAFRTSTAEIVNDSDLEEAAIRFANGDDAGAEAALLEAVRSPNARREQIDIWSAALFDLYRATGQQARFDSVAIDFAERFGRSAPAWFSMPEVLGLKALPSIVRTIPSHLAEEPVWRSPTQLTQSGVDELRLALANAPPPWFIDWGTIEVLAEDSIVPLASVVAQWAKSPVQLRFRNTHQLDRALRAATRAGDKSVNQTAWQLRMDMLRILGLQDDFDLVALEYCVTFEVSPPAWRAVLCTYVDESVPLQPAGRDATGPASNLDPGSEVPDSEGLTLPMGYDSAPAALSDLTGELQGEATESLARLEQARLGGDRLVVSCANLIRVDFPAAGSLLNWVASRQSEGCHVQFREVHGLVASFFHVIGIHEYARIVLRSH